MLGYYLVYLQAPSSLFLPVVSIIWLTVALFSPLDYCQGYQGFYHLYSVFSYAPGDQENKLQKQMFVVIINSDSLQKFHFSVFSVACRNTDSATG